MDKAQFWRLIEDAKEKSRGECEEQAELLEKVLATLPPEEIVAFDRILDAFRDEAYRWDLWGAGQLINGLCSDDGFLYFRCWLIAQGKKIYENALANPDSLADVIEPGFANAECEEILYVAGTAYEATTGQEIPYFGTPQPDASGNYTVPEPAGPKPNVENASTFYPHLWARDEAQNEEE